MQRKRDHAVGPPCTMQDNYLKPSTYRKCSCRRKRFILFPPSMWGSMHPYPFLHPAQHQAQPVLQTDSPSELRDRYPSLAGVRAWDVVLEPGDVLYVPPFWPHTVTSQTPAVSVSVISPSTNEALAGILTPWVWPLKTPHALSNLTTPSHSLAGAISLVRSVGLEVMGTSPSSFASLLRQRYASLANKLVPSKLPHGFNCPKFEAAVSSKLPAGFNDAAAAFGQRAAARLSSITDRAIVATVFADWVESTLALSTHPNNVPDIVCGCLLKGVWSGTLCEVSR